MATLVSCDIQDMYHEYAVGQIPYTKATYKLTDSTSSHMDVCDKHLEMGIKKLFEASNFPQNVLVERIK